MSITISGSNAISGLSGMDTNFDEVLSQLKQIESTQLNRLEAWKADWQMRYDAFTQIIEQVQAASNVLTTLSDKNNFVTKLATSSNSNVITAVANASAQDVQHTIKVSQVASNAIWANTGHIFSSKNDIITLQDDSGKYVDGYFNYTYAGKDYSFKVAAGTSLDSFVSMFNNSADNPGLKISVIQTGSGYVFQVAGTSTGAANDLTIHNSSLVGMDATDSQSTWVSNNALDLSQSVIDPTNYIFDLVMTDGTKKTVTVSGTATGQELAAKISAAAGGITATFDDTTGELTIDGVKSFSRRTEGDSAYSEASTTFYLSGAVQSNKTDIKLNASGGFAAGMADDEDITFTVTMDDYTTREVTVKAGSTKRKLFAALAQATQSGSDINVSSNSDGSMWGVTLSGVRSVTCDTTGVDLDQMSSVLKKNSSGVKDTLGATLSATATLTFTDMDAKIDTKVADGEDGVDLTYAIIDNNGNAYNLIGFKSGMSNDDFVTQLQSEINRINTDYSAGIGFNYDATNKTVTLDNVQSFKHTQGGIESASYTTSYTAKTTIAATNNNTGTNSTGNLFYQDGSGKYLLEEAPDLVYTFKANNGSVGTLTLASGTSMQDILAAMQNPNSSAWSWVDKTGAATTAPVDFAVSFTDSEGNEYVDATDGHALTLAEIEALGEKPYLSLQNIQSVSGPDISGQISQTTNWNIQRAANCKYEVDNWPIELESDTNQISDVIEGVVFTIQDTGDARLTISTDITSVEESIQTFLDAVNSVILTVNELMKYDENKEVTSNDPDDIGNSNYSASGLTSQKGSLLTGNYGVQLFKSRFQSLLGSNPPGFQSRASADNVLSGDLLASLANLGIKTDTDSTSSTYGLLVIAPSSSIAAIQQLDQDNYENMINNNLEAVVDFFCASGSGSSTSIDMRYVSHVEGITEPGNYEVKYEVLEDGTITNVTVGGQPAVQDFSMPGNYFSVTKGDCRGLSFQIDNVEVGQHPKEGEDPMYLRIKQGMVQTVNSWLKDELKFTDVSISTNSTADQIADVISIKSENGALMSLRDNYMQVMESIDAKIEREQRRLSTWESRQKTIFANLETLLANYSQQQESLEQQLEQLKNN